MKNIPLILLFFTASFIMNCASPVSVTKENTASSDLNKYKLIYVGLLQFSVNDWKIYGFESKKQWINAIRKHNSNLQTYLKEQLPGRKIYRPKTMSQVYRSRKALYLNIKFDKLDATDDLSSIDTLFVTVYFIDSSKRKTVYKASFAASSDAPFPRNLKATSFDGRLDNEMYNLAVGIAEKFK